MRDWKSYAQEINTLNATDYQWPSDCFSINQEKLVQMDLMMLQSIARLLLSNVEDDKKENAVRLFLWLRGKIFVNTSLDYTLNPLLPSNRLCLSMGKKIARPDESLCQILMPTIEQVYGTTVDASDVKSATVDRQFGFAPHQYITHANHHALIAIKDLFELAKHDVDHLFSSKKSIHTLSADDLARLRSIAGRASETFFDALEKIHRVKNKRNNSIGSAILDLCDALIEGSREGTGSEWNIDMSMCRIPLLIFYEKWKHMSSDRVTKMQELKTPHTTLTLESYVLALFLRSKEMIPGIEITNRDVRRVINDGIIPCAKHIADQLRYLVDQHPELLSLTVSSEEHLCHDEVIPSAEELETLEKNFLSALSQRTPMLGMKDEDCLRYQTIMTIFANRLFECDDMRMLNAIKIIAPLVRDQDDFANALTLLPMRHWPTLIANLKSQFDVIFQNPICVYTTLRHILKKLPASQWALFFDAYAQASDNAVIGYIKFHLLQFLNEFSEKQWCHLVNAMKPIYPLLYMKGRDIVWIFLKLFTVDWKKYYTALKELIDSVFTSSMEVSYFLVAMLTRPMLWPEVAAIFGDSLLPHFQSTEFLPQTLLQVDKYRRMEFLKTFIKHFSTYEFTQMKIVAVLKALDITFFKDFFTFLGRKRIENYFPNLMEIMAFLKLLETKVQKEACLNALSTYLSDMPIHFFQFRQLFSLFPECGETIILLYLKQLPQMILQVASTVEYCRIRGIPEKTECVSDFHFYTHDILPDMLSVNYFSKLCSYFTFVSRQNVPLALRPHIETLTREFSSLDKRAVKHEASPIHIVIKKLELLSTYLKLPEHVNVSDPFAIELHTVFGSNFFSMLLRLRDFIEYCATPAEKAVVEPLPTQAPTSTSVVSIAHHRPGARPLRVPRQQRTLGFFSQQQPAVPPTVRTLRENVRRQRH